MRAHSPRPTIGNPDTNFFGKLSLQLAQNSQVELSYNSVKANQDNLVHSPPPTGFRDGYQLSNSGYHFTPRPTPRAAKWTAQVGDGFTNELIVGYQRDPGQPRSAEPRAADLRGRRPAGTGAVPSTNIAAAPSGSRTATRWTRTSSR